MKPTMVNNSIRTKMAGMGCLPNIIMIASFLYVGYRKMGLQHGRDSAKLKARLSPSTTK